MFQKPFHGTALKGSGWQQALKNRSKTSRLVGVNTKGGKYCGGCMRCGRPMKGGCMKCGGVVTKGGCMSCSRKRPVKMVTLGPGK